MSNIIPDSGSSFFRRLLTNDAARKGLVGAVAGLLVAAITEAVWPTR